MYMYCNRAITLIHMMIMLAIFGGFFHFFLPLFDVDIQPEGLWTLSFALTFSSTVFAVDSFETAGEEESLYASIAIGILIIQDLAGICSLISGCTFNTVMQYLSFLNHLHGPNTHRSSYDPIKKDDKISHERTRAYMISHDHIWSLSHVTVTHNLHRS